MESIWITNWLCSSTLKTSLCGQCKNQADICMAIDVLEIAMTCPQIQIFVVVSGDSDFSPLVAKLREYDRYTLGIGPRSITHELLVRRFDEFVYLETALGETREEYVQY